MILKIRLDDSADADLIDALAHMPKGERSAQARMLLRLALAGTGGLLVRMEALERRLDGFTRAGGPPTPQTAPTADAQRATVGLFKKFGALDED